MEDATITVATIDIIIINIPPNITDFDELRSPLFSYFPLIDIMIGFLMDYFFRDIQLTA